MNPNASKKVVYGLIAFFVVGGLGFLAAAAFAWTDEHSGTGGTAQITHCYKGGSSRTASSVHCNATWTLDGKQVSGWVQNARLWKDGKEVSVRIHGADHVTVQTYWIPIGLAIFGVLVLAMGAWLVVLSRRPPRPQPT